MSLVIFSPLIRKIIKSVDKSKKDVQPNEDNIYESVDSHRVVQRILNSDSSPVGSVEFIEPKPIQHKEDDMYKGDISAIKKIDNISVLKKAVIWKEILSPPVALRDLGRDDYF